MIDLLKQELTDRGAFSGTIPDALSSLAKAIPNMKIPERMKLTFAVSELILFASQFRRNIHHWNGSSIPVNAITFSLASSGEGKDSSVNSIRKCFYSAYKHIEEYRKELAHQAARNAAAADGVENPNDWATYKDYYQQPQDLFVAPGTVEGFINHLNQLDDAGIGAGFLYSGEIGSQLMNSPTIIQNIEFLAETYDEGKREAKIIRSKENQTKAIKNLPISALFVGSQDNILFEQAVKQKFRTEFSTKLARRSFFNYNKEKISLPIFNSIAEALAYEKEIEDKSTYIRNQLDSIFQSIAEYQLSNLGKSISVSEQVRDLFLIYKRYNDEVAGTIKRQYPMSKIVRTHLQWKALKLAGALAIIDCSEKIETKHYISAISFVEILDKDMLSFEADLTRDPYELFIQYMHDIVEDGKSYINLHTLNKMGYISGTANAKSKIKELIEFAASADNSGIYKEVDKGIEFTKIIKTAATGISYLKVSGSKDQRAKQCASGYSYGEYTFASLANMLKGDYAYSPFRFKDGMRGKDYIDSGCKWIAFDIDKSDITDEECHAMLHNFNHHIVRTSDKSNPFKFRILLELDSYVDVPDKQWKDFTRSIADFLSLTTDPLPKAQIFFSYAGRTIYSVVDASPIEVRDHLLYANGQAETKTPAIRLTSKEKQAQLADPLNTFDYAFEAEPGGRSLSLIRAAKHAKDLGLDNPQIIDLVWEINNYWQFPLEEAEVQRTVVSQIERW